MQQASKAGAFGVDHLSAKVAATASAAIGCSGLRQHHLLNARDLVTASSEPQLGSGPKEQAYVERLKQLITCSPDRRTKSRAALIAIGTGEFGLSQRRARALRESVIDQLGSSAWRKSGRPRRPQS